MSRNKLFLVETEINQYMVSAEMDKVYSARPENSRGQALANQTLVIDRTRLYTTDGRTD